MDSILKSLSGFYETKVVGYFNMLAEYPIKIVALAVDLILVGFLVYAVAKILHGTRAMYLVKGIVILIIATALSDFFSLRILHFILSTISTYGVIMVIVIFQPEIRDILEQLGRNELLGRHKTLSIDERERLVYEIVNACDYMSKEKIGALITIERDRSLANYIDKAKKIYADLSSDLLISIFFPNNPLHDGGVIIQGDRITCAGAVFPTSNSSKINRRLGTRHRAALGVAEETDAICIVVSEETGRVSIALKGEMLYNLTIDDVRMMLIDELRPKQDVEIEDEEEIKEEEIYEEDR